MARSPIQLALYVALFSIPLGYLYTTVYPSVQRVITTSGVYRYPTALASVASASDIVLIENTIHCEDLHYYAPTHELYTACEDSHETRFSWFPPLTEFNASVIPRSRGGLFIINPDTKKARKLKLVNFSGPFATHGIDVIPDPKAGPKKAVYILAVNHLPNPEYWDASYAPRAAQAGKSQHQPHKARSQIEIFRHEVGSSKALHVRSVWDPLIRTPNDIAALSPTHFLVTNDHYYREGRLRLLEDLYPGAKWTDTIEIKLNELITDRADAGVKATVAIDKFWNNNGLGHGSSERELLLCSAVGGSLHLVEPSATDKGNSYKVVEDILLDSAVDNPSYFRDPYASGAFDASGYVLAGLGRCIDLGHTHADPDAKDPVVVWYVKKAEGGGGWEKRLIFEDDSSTIRSASAAVLVAIDPAKEGGKRRAWLYVTGFVSSNVVAVKVDL